MRFPRQCLVAALGVVLIALRVQARPPVEKEGPPMLGKSPFQLALSFNGLGSLRATLVNRSDKSEVYLKDQFLQPSQLVLVTSSGRTIASVDKRRVMKLNRMVNQEAYVPILPRGRAILAKATFEPEKDGTYSLAWGPYHFAEIPPGEYRAQVVWVSEEDDFSDDFETKQAGTIPGIWKGKLKSPWVEISLPKPR